MRGRSIASALGLLLGAGCSPSERGGASMGTAAGTESDSASTGELSGTSATETTGATATSNTTTTGAPETSGSVKFDLPMPDTPPVFDVCEASDLEVLGGGAPEDCESEAPPESFDPVEEWVYPPTGTSMQSWVTPLVVNFTDDNSDGVIDMCDTPDVILEAFDGPTCALHIIDGNFAQSQTVHQIIDQYPIHCTGNPAVGDIDGDNEPEIVVVSSNAAETLLAIDNDGSLLWESDPNPYPTNGQPWRSGGVALHDMDGDGTVEILYNHLMFDADGALLWGQPDPSGSNTWLQATIAADLDGDMDLELLTAFSAHDFAAGWFDTPLWDFVASGTLSANSIPHVANFDADPMPEVLYTSDDGYFLVEHDGTPVWNAPIKPALMQACNGSNWGGFMRAASIHDYDNDGQAEFAAAACNVFAIYDATPMGPVPISQHIVQDNSGGTGTTSFDFLGDGTAEPVYSDETTAWAYSYDGMAWQPRLQLPRRSPTYMEYPSVADIDNDGSAEILVPSADASEPALVVFGDADDRWIQARRIYNQHAYSVTHVREDGTIPPVTLHNWDFFNTFRANSQIEGGSLCVPAG